MGLAVGVGLSLGEIISKGVAEVDGAQIEKFAAGVECQITIVIEHMNQFQVAAPKPLT